MSPDRLEALRRQRALVAQHLAWLDSEITAVASPGKPVVTNLVTNPAPAALAPAPAVVTAPASLSPAAPAPWPAGITPPTVAVPRPAEPEVLAAANARADEIIAQYSTEGRFDPKGARRGCILLASAVLLLGLAGSMFVYLLYYNK